MKQSNSRMGLVKQVKNPLIFFTLAILIIESIFGLVIGLSDIGASLKFVTICLMAFLFLVVIGSVTYITVKHPTHLYEHTIPLPDIGNIREYPKLALTNGTSYPLIKNVTTIGRAQENDIILVDRHVSKHHASVELEEEDYRIRDISQNGVFLNSRKIPTNQPIKLADGDLIRIGYTELRYAKKENSLQ